MMAKGWPDVIAAPATYTTNIARSYRANSGTTPTTSSTTAASLTGWTPITGTSNQSISNLQLQTINGLSCVVFQSGASFTLNSVNIQSGSRIWIGGLTGYNFVTTTSTITSLIITATSAYRLISIMISSSNTDDAEVLYRLQYHGSFYQNMTAGFLSISGSTLTISGT
jgi:hypothetical protein